MHSDTKLLALRKPMNTTGSPGRDERLVRPKLLSFKAHHVLVFALFVGCGGAGSNARKVNDSFHQVQVEEATIEAGRTQTYEEDRPCPVRCQGAVQTCSACQKICEIANDLEDPDALIRCRRAQRTCADTTRYARLRCNCKSE